MNKVFKMADESHKWINDFMVGLIPLALTGIAATGKVLIDWWKNKKAADIKIQVQQNTTSINAISELIDTLKQGMKQSNLIASEANARADFAIQQTAECEKRHHELIENYNDVILKFAFKGEKLEKTAKALDVSANISKIVANAVSDKLTNPDNSEILKNLKDSEQ